MMVVWSIFVVGSGIIYGNNTKANRVSATCDPMKRKYEELVGTKFGNFLN